MIMKNNFIKLNDQYNLMKKTKIIINVLVHIISFLIFLSGVILILTNLVTISLLDIDDIASTQVYNYFKTTFAFSNIVGIILIVLSSKIKYRVKNYCYLISGSIVIVSIILFTSTLNFKLLVLFLVILMCILFYWTILFVQYLIKTKNYFKEKLDENDLEKVMLFLNDYKGNSDTHLIFLKDKNLFWACEGKVLIAYSKLKGKLLVMGDPIGETELFSEAIQEFRDFAKIFKLKVVFYRISERNMHLYHEHGYFFFKLGQVAKINLETFDLKGKKKQDLRTIRNKLERENYDFQMLIPPFAEDDFLRMREISDEWLHERDENRFSMGWFDKEYLEKGPVGVLRDGEGKMLAFASIMPAYNDELVSIDLMRFTEEAPNGVMDGLFLSLILWAKDREYKYFNLGMAPLSNVGVNPNCHNKEKLANMTFKYGEKIYGFKGLERYKKKFDPEWESKYLAYPKGIFALEISLEIARFIAKPFDK